MHFGAQQPRAHTLTDAPEAIKFPFPSFRHQQPPWERAVGKRRRKAPSASTEALSVQNTASKLAR